ncbi:hypothetical protein BSNK01_05380 [Bacillaceae bacterium]
MDRKTVMVTMEKTLFTARLIDGFWERWLAHGVERNDLEKIRPTLASLDHWIEGWRSLAEEKMAKGEEWRRRGRRDQAESAFRAAGLYFYLLQWIFPEPCPQKERWFRVCLAAFREADALADIETRYVSLTVDGVRCTGRVCVPKKNPERCIVIINPFDSAKEELYTYERDFIRAGFATVSFDGPGQGETYACGGGKANRKRWKEFVEKVIAYAASEFLRAEIYLFGTSSGASWALYGSGHPCVRKAAAVSPAVCGARGGTKRMPDYFLERMKCALVDVEEQDILPDLQQFRTDKPVLLFHGRRDVMVSAEEIYALHRGLANGMFVEFADEGHCCNFKLPLVRRIAMQWFLHTEEGKIHDV